MTDRMNLTPRERAVLARLAAGETNKEIARTLGDPNDYAVKNQVKRILVKLRVNNRVKAAIFAVKNPEILAPLGRH